jgi:hypothetical protein
MRWTLNSHIGVRVKSEVRGNMRIGELRRRTGVSERLLRYYEEQGLLRPQRRPSGYREYDDSDVTRDHMTSRINGSDTPNKVLLGGC